MEFKEACNTQVEFYDIDSGCIYKYCEIGFCVNRDEKDKPPFQLIDVELRHINAEYRLCDPITSIRRSDLETLMNECSYPVDDRRYEQLCVKIFGQD